MMRISNLRISLPAVLFLLAQPVVLSLINGLNYAGLGKFMTRLESVLHSLTIYPPFWLSQALGSLLVLWLDRRRRLPVWVTLLLGGLLGTILARPYFYYRFNATAASLPAGIDLGPPMPLVPQSLEAVLRYMELYLPGTIIWVLLATATIYAARLSSDGNASKERQATDDAVPFPETGFIRRLGRIKPEEVYALEAEDHYVRVHLQSGSQLLLYRFSDAIAEIGADGVRVHRSFWVRKDAVKRVTPHGKGYVLSLASGIEIPVSRAYREAARLAGVLGKRACGV